MSNLATDKIIRKLSEWFDDALRELVLESVLHALNANPNMAEAITIDKPQEIMIALWSMAHPLAVDSELLHKYLRALATLLDWYQELRLNLSVASSELIAASPLISASDTLILVVRFPYEVMPFCKKPNQLDTSGMINLLWPDTQAIVNRLGRAYLSEFGSPNLFGTDNVTST